MDFVDLLAAVNVFDTQTLALLFLIAILAGWVDAIGGGGGLIIVPTLLWAGLSPIQALATSKMQSCFGALTATWNYTRKGLVKPRDHLLGIILTFSGSLCGAWAVQQVDASALTHLIPGLLIVFALYFMFSPRLDDSERQARLTYPVFAATAGFTLGFYDGFFGPGTGTFFAAAFVLLLGYSLPRATGGTKLLNLTSNLAAFLLFALSGQVLWLPGLLMGAGQIIGSFIGSHLAIRHGSRLIRPILVIVSLLVSLRLLLAA